MNETEKRKLIRSKHSPVIPSHKTVRGDPKRDWIRDSTIQLDVKRQLKDRLWHHPTACYFISRLEAVPDVFGLRSQLHSGYSLWSSLNSHLHPELEWGHWLRQVNQLAPKALLKGIYCRSFNPTSAQAHLLQKKSHQIMTNSWTKTFFRFSFANGLISFRLAIKMSSGSDKLYGRVQFVVRISISS